MASSLKLLVVEDEPTTLALYTTFFSRYFPDVQILTAMNPQDAVTLFGQYHPEVIVTDCRVPHKHDGLRIAEAVCAADPNVTIFIVTADADTVSKIVEQKQAGKHCIEAVYAKPLNLRDFTHHVKKIILSIRAAQPNERAEKSRPSV